MDKNKEFLTPEEIASLTGSGNRLPSKKEVTESLEDENTQQVLIVKGFLTEKTVVYDVKMDNNVLNDQQMAAVATSAAASLIKIAIQLANRNGVEKSVVMDMFKKSLGDVEMI